MSDDSYYGKATRLAYAEKGAFTITVLIDNNDGTLLFRITPGTLLSDDQFNLWFPDFSAPKMEVHTTSVTLYEGEVAPDWPIQKLKEHFQVQSELLASFLDNIASDTPFN